MGAVSKTSDEPPRVLEKLEAIQVWIVNRAIHLVDMSRVSISSVMDSDGNHEDFKAVLAMLNNDL